MTLPVEADTAGRPRTSRPKLDAVSAAAVELAREALLETTEPGQVGEHLGVLNSGERLVTHMFACEMAGYRGWAWHVVVARAPRAKAATVCETTLLPGDGALLAPDWEPWEDRLRPSDVGADDLLPYKEFDERLEEGYEQTDDAEADRLAIWELGLGRARVLSPLGRAEAAERWIGSDFGPREISSRGRKGTISASCASCGFLTLMAGSLRTEFGVCTNEWSPADGRVVSLQYGCGSHSETGRDEGPSEFAKAAEGVVVDDLEVEYEPLVPEAEAAGTDETSEAESAVPADAPEASAPEAPVAETPEQEKTEPDEKAEPAEQETTEPDEPAEKAEA